MFPHDIENTVVNRNDWWRIRIDHPVTGTPENYEDTGATLYWSDSAERWILEAPDVNWEADDAWFNTLDDDRLPPGIQNHFGDKDTIWEQFSLVEEQNGPVKVKIVCRDSKHPTQQPTQQPTDQPTQQMTPKPTEQPTNQPTQQPTGEPTDQYYSS